MKINKTKQKTSKRYVKKIKLIKEALNDLFLVNNIYLLNEKLI